MTSIRAFSLGAQRARRAILTLAVLAGSVGTGAAQQPAPTRELDNHSGIFFFCKGLANEAWTARTCQDAGAELAALATKHKKPIVLLKIGDTREKYPALAKAAGFESTTALWVLLSIDPRPTGGWDLAARADGHAKPATPGAPQTVTFSKSGLTMSPEGATEKSKELLGAIMFALATPMRPL